MNINPENEKLYSRRRFLELSGMALGAAAGGSILGACSSNTSPKSIVRPSKGLSQIDHVIFVVQENRSFDHYFGTLSGVNGFQNAIDTNESILYQNFSANTTASPTGKLLPFHLDTLKYPVACILDLDHSWGPQHKYWNNGKMDGFGSEHLGGHRFCFPVWRFGHERHSHHDLLQWSGEFGHACRGSHVYGG